MIRPRSGCCLCSPAAALGTRHAWWAEWREAVETVWGGRRRWQLPQPPVATSSQSPEWLGRSNCCRQGNGKWQRGHQGPTRTNNEMINKGLQSKLSTFWQNSFFCCQNAISFFVIVQKRDQVGGGLWQTFHQLRSTLQIRGGWAAFSSCQSPVTEAREKKKAERQRRCQRHGKRTSVLQKGSTNTEHKAPAHWCLLFLCQGQTH